MPLFDKIIEKSRRNAIDEFDKEKYELNQLLLFVSADLCEGASIDIIEQLKPIGLYRFEDKKTIDAIKKNAGSLVKDIDTMCSEEYSIRFGDLSDEVRTLVVSYLKNKIIRR